MSEEPAIDQDCSPGTHDARMNDAARVEVLQADGARTLGENLEQADALIRAAFELASGFERAQS